jgi:hypothetical protein
MQAPARIANERVCEPRVYVHILEITKVCKYYNRNVGKSQVLLLPPRLHC